MTNFEKFKADLTVERLTNMLADMHCEGVCDYCAYKGLCFTLKLDASYDKNNPRTEITIGRN